MCRAIADASGVRELSVRLVEDLLGRDRALVGVISQRSPDVDEPTFKELYTVGTIARVVKVIRLGPSNYSVVAVSEGARPIGGQTIESGDPDAFGNRKLGGVGSVLSDYLEKRTKDKVIYQRLAYLMRSGTPDSLDQLVANNYGSLAADLLRRDDTGKMVAVVDGRYNAVPVEVGGRAKKRVDVARFYDPEEYRPKVAYVMGMPMFLH